MEKLVEDFYAVFWPKMPADRQAALVEDTKRRIPDAADRVRERYHGARIRAHFWDSMVTPVDDGRRYNTAERLALAVAANDANHAYLGGKGGA